MKATLAASIIATMAAAGAAAGAAADDDFSLPNSQAHPLRLWFSKPSKYWNDSMPIGNGRLGGMVWGSPDSEKISTNEDSFWSGTKMDRLNPDALTTLPKVQQLLLQGLAPDAESLAAVGLKGQPTSMRVYQPGGDLQIHLDGVGGIDNCTDYERWLDLTDGTAGVYFAFNGTAYKREYIVSAPQDILAVRLTANNTGMLNVRVFMDRPAHDLNRFVDSSYAENGDTIISNFSAGDIHAVFGASVKTIGGTVQQIGDAVQVTGADEVWVYSDTETTVRQADPLAEVHRKLAAAMGSTYQQIRDAHVADYQALFSRVDLSLGTSTDGQKANATDMRRLALQNGGWDPEFVALFFQLGRYLLIASSRPGTYPPNLQGIWNYDMSPGWGSKFTIDINLEMNYWPAQVTNLQELTQPLYDLLETVYESGKTTAQRMYGCRGWCAHHNTDIWGDTAPQDVWPGGTYWMLGGVWLTAHVFENYRYTLDKEFLGKYYHLFHDAALFFVDFLVDYKGWKVCVPSTSPENSYRNGSITGSLSIGTTMDNTLLRELFDNLVAATEILGMPEDEVVTAAKELRDKLPPLTISPTTGRLMEWIEDFEEPEPGNRHFSHLYGLYPGKEVSMSSKEIQDGAAAALKWRVSNPSLDSTDMGWSPAWSMSLHARTRDGPGVEASMARVISLLQNNTLNNGRGSIAPFQIDGNFGSTAGIAEALLQSHEDGTIFVLPALLPSSDEGMFSGLVARGGFVVGAEWGQGGMISRITIESRLGGSVNVTVGTGQELALEGAYPVNGSNSGVLMLDTIPGGKYVIVGGQ